MRYFPGVKAVGYSHRPATRRKAKRLGVASEIVDDIETGVRQADIVVLATPIHAFEEVFGAVGDTLPPGCIVTDVGSTKVLPYRWARRRLPKRVHYVGSHPIAGSEQRGVQFARADLFEGALCILTTTKTSNQRAVHKLRRFWSGLGCSVTLMKRSEHDRIFANVSHLPHVTAASLINANRAQELKFVGPGFMDATRIASGPANVWADVALSNTGNIIKGIDRVVGELLRFKKAIKNGNTKQVESLLERARSKRASLINHKTSNKVKE
ncbi:MAG: prephenate dehydrogenase [Planctomycetota bacterium]